MSEEKVRTYVCKRARMAGFLMKKGFTPYKVAPDRDNPMYDVFLFTGTPELYKAVAEYIGTRHESGFLPAAGGEETSDPEQSAAEHSTRHERSGDK